MGYSCTDFADDIFNELSDVGAIHNNEANDEKLADNASLQADYALRGINRLVEVRDAAIAFRMALAKSTANEGIWPEETMRAAAKRLDQALAEVMERAN